MEGGILAQNANKASNHISSSLIVSQPDSLLLHWVPPADNEEKDAHKIVCCKQVVVASELFNIVVNEDVKTSFCCS